jgi:acyl transferase domain-containing protein
MDPMLGELAEIARGLTFAEPTIPVVSSVTGKPEDLSTPEYWVRQVREPVRFADCVQFLSAEGVRCFLELGPDAVVAPMIEDCVVGPAAIVPSARRDHPECDAITTARARMHVHRTDLDPVTVPGARRVPLPTYAFEHQRYWLASDSTVTYGAGTEPVERTLLTRLDGLSAAEQESVLVEFVRAEASAVLGHESLEAVAVDDDFLEIGFTSMTAVELRNRLRTATRLELPVSVMFDCPTPLAVAAHLRAELSATTKGDM